MNPLLLQDEAAQTLRLSPRTMEKMRTTGGGPRFVKLGRRVLYDPKDLAEWIEQHKVGSTAESR